MRKVGASQVAVLSDEASHIPDGFAESKTVHDAALWLGTAGGTSRTMSSHLSEDALEFLALVRFADPAAASYDGCHASPAPPGPPARLRLLPSPARTSSPSVCIVACASCLASSMANPDCRPPAVPSTKCGAVCLLSFHQ
jgi:hypothetical protein